MYTRPVSCMHARAHGFLLTNLSYKSTIFKPRIIYKPFQVDAKYSSVFKLPPFLLIETTRERIETRLVNGTWWIYLDRNLLRCFADPHICEAFFFFFFCEKWLVESVGRLLFGNWGIGKISFKGKSILKFPRFFRVLNTFCLPRNRRRVTVLTVLLLIESNYFREFNTHISMVLTILFNSRILSFHK